MEAEQRHFSIVYRERPGRPVITANGAYGSAASDGNSVIFHLYIEHPTIPSATLHPVDAQGNLGDSDDVKRGDVTREIQATIVLAPEVAAALGAFLGEQGAIASALRAAGAGGSGVG